MNIRTKISPPWITYLNQLKALFGEDPDIKIIYNGDKNQIQIKLLVNDSTKAAALEEILPPWKRFGNVSMTIAIVPTNQLDEPKDFATLAEIFEAAFKNNPVFAFTKVVSGMWSFNCVYVVFRNKVVQFFNDNLADVYGNVSTLYQNLAEDVFDNECLEGVHYCTDMEKVMMPLGEWP